MSSVSKSIFVLEEKTSEILYDYISLVFTDKKIYKNNSGSFLLCGCCNICDYPYDSVVCYANIYSNKNEMDKFTEWIIDLSKRYLLKSFIDVNNLSVYIIECINTIDEDKILIENMNKASVVFHFNDNKNGYVTTHDSNLNFLVNDRKYIIVTFN